jgi:predicted DNA-binding protein with PD1-like motif
MRAKLVAAGTQRTYVLAFDKGDGVTDGLLRFAREHDVTAAGFTAIGAFSDVKLG